MSGIAATGAFALALTILDGSLSSAVLFFPVLPAAA
jgi:hypothetical protein